MSVKWLMGVVLLIGGLGAWGQTGSTFFDDGKSYTTYNTQVVSDLVIHAPYCVGERYCVDPVTGQVFSPKEAEVSYLDFTGGQVYSAVHVPESPWHSDKWDVDKTILVTFGDVPDGFHSYINLPNEGGWIVTCLLIDSGRKVISPNWGNPDCDTSRWAWVEVVDVPAVPAVGSSGVVCGYYSCWQPAFTYTCYDKRRILQTSEDGNKWCHMPETERKVNN